MPSVACGTASSTVHAITALATDAFETESPVNGLGLSGGDDAFLDGDTLVFDGNGAILSMNNDTPAGTDYTLQMTGSQQHWIAGNEIALGGGIAISNHSRDSRPRCERGNWRPSWL